MSEFEQWYEQEGHRLAFGSDENSDCYFGARESWGHQQAKIDELQGRIDGALRFYNEAKSPHNIGMIQMAIYLKGNKDEN